MIFHLYGIFFPLFTCAKGGMYGLNSIKVNMFFLFYLYTLYLYK